MTTQTEAQELRITTLRNTIKETFKAASLEAAKLGAKDPIAMMDAFKDIKA